MDQNKIRVRDLSDFRHSNTSEKRTTSNSIKITPGIYEHYKGGRYKVIGMAKHVERQAESVVYHPFHNPEKMYIISATSFNELVSVTSGVVKKFTKVE
jgi:hypothetical protein